MADAPRPPEYWLFQFPMAEDRSDIAPGKLSAGQAVPWPVTSNARRIRKSDIVFLWQAGETGGLHGWGRIVSMKKSASAQVQVEALLPQPISPKEVLSVKELADLTVLSQAQSAIDFPLSTAQASGFARLMRSRNQAAPEVAVERIRSSALRRINNLLSQAESMQGFAPIRATVADLGGLLSNPDNVSEGNLESLLRRLAGEIGQYAPKDPQSASVQSRLLEEIETIVQKELDRPPPPPAFGTRAVEAAVPEVRVLRVAAAPLAAAVDFGEASPLGTPTPSSPQPAPVPPTPAPPQSQAPEELKVPAGRGITRWWEEDRANITDDVRNLARYIAAASLQPPQAIGIFGDWGSGKTFFMNAVRSEIANIAWQSEEAKGASAFCSQVVPIEFNAWHYVESNLWASLATHIFGSLHRSLSARTAVKEDVNKLFESLETAKAAVEAAERERKVKEEMVATLMQQRDDAEKRVGERSDAVQFAQKKLEDLAKDRILQAISGAVIDNRDKLEKLVGGKAQIEAAAIAGKDVVGLAREAQSVLTPLWLELRTNPHATSLAIAVVAVLIVIPPAVSWLASVVFGNKSVAELGALAGTLLSMAAGAGAWLKANGQKVLNAARQVQQLRADAAKAAGDEMRKPIAEAEAKLQAGQKELAAVSENLEKEKARLAEAEGAVRGEDIVVRLRQFLEDRVRNKTYEQHLGLVTLIRKDFETLSDIMAAARERAAAVAKFDAKGGTRTVPIVERIVLYIDDLDRCPHDKVVDVLQAVHLLLGFKLFVVLVGVDVRWVGKALQKQYPELLADGNGRDAAGARPERGGASSDDYLEKIFQIPFRIPPMNSAARRNFVTALVSPKAAAPAAEVLTVPPLQLNPREFQLDARETQTIIDLRDCLGRSPRRLKRFVDVYRLMRAGMPDGEVEGLMEKHQYVGILGVFALMTSLSNAGPPLVEAFFGDLQRLQAGNLANLKFEAWLTSWKGRVDGFDYEPAARVMRYFDAETRAPRPLLLDGLLAWSDRIGRYTFHDIHLDS